MVIATLRSLIDFRTICRMEFPRTRYSWVTMLLEIRSPDNSHYLLIDKVAGFEAALSSSLDRNVSLEFTEKTGVPCRFSTRVIALHNQAIWCELPQVIYRIQRRQYFRIEALLGMEITFRIGSSGEREKAKVKNYGAGGAAFFMEGDLKLGAGDFLNDIHLTIREGTEWIDFHIPQAVVRRIESPSMEERRFVLSSL